MKIFIDLDDVLFNTKDFKEDLLDIFVKNEITKEQFKKSYWGKTYNLEKQLKAIERDYEVNSEKLRKDINIFLKDLREYVFSDVYDFLRFAGKDNMFIVSYGHKNFQEQKIKNSGLEKYFENIFITHSNKSEVIQDVVKNEDLKGETLYFLDDRIKYIEEVKSALPNVKTFLMKRFEGRYDDESNKRCDFVAKNLEEVKNILTR